MTFKMLPAALTACALVWSQAALADVKYTYTGNKFTEAYAIVPGPQDSNADAWIMDITGRLRQQQLDFELTTPVYLPAGWSSFDRNGVYGGLANALLASGESSVSWSLIHPDLGMSGTAALGATPPSSPETNGGLYVSLHVDAQQKIDAWQLSYTYYTDYGQPTWAMYYRESLTISSATGDEVHFASADQAYYLGSDAYSRAPGVWSVVPETSTAAMLLAGLGTLTWLRRRATMDC